MDFPIENVFFYAMLNYQRVWDPLVSFDLEFGGENSQKEGNVVLATGDQEIFLGEINEMLWTSLSNCQGNN